MNKVLNKLFNTLNIYFVSFYFYTSLCLLNKNRSGINKKHSRPKILKESMKAHKFACFINVPYCEYCAMCWATETCVY